MQNFSYYQLATQLTLCWCVILFDQWPHLHKCLVKGCYMLTPYPAPRSPLILWSSNSHFFHLRQSINADVSTTSARRSRWTSQCTWRLCGCWVQPRISSASWPDEGIKSCHFLLSAKWRYAFRMAPSQYQWPPGLFHVMFRMGFQPKPSFAPSWEVCHTQGIPDMPSISLATSDGFYLSQVSG